MVATPIYVGQGVYVAGTGSNSCSPPAATLPGDLLIGYIHTANQAVPSTPSGWTAVGGDSPQGVGTAGAAGATRVTLFYRWATIPGGGSADDMTSGDSGDHQGFAIVAFRGVRRDGTNTPWDVTAGTTSGSSDTAVSVPGDTTTVDECLIFGIAAFDTDGANAQTVGWDNSGLTGITTGTGGSTAQGNGGGAHTFTARKATAGAFAATTATLTTATVDACIMLALAPSLAPWVLRRGTLDGQLGAATAAWPTHAAGDLGVVFVEHAVEPVAAPSGWTEIDSPGGSQGSAGTGTGIQAFWKVAASSSEAAFVASDVGDHQIVQMITLANADPTSPVDAADSAGNAASTTGTAPAVTTLGADRLIVAAIANGADVNSTATYSAWTNANLASIDELIDDTRTPGNGGGFGVAFGVKASAGSTGATTCTLSGSLATAGMTIAFRATAAAASGYGFPVLSIG